MIKKPRHPAGPLNVPRTRIELVTPGFSVLARSKTVFSPESYRCTFKRDSRTEWLCGLPRIQTKLGGLFGGTLIPGRPYPAASGRRGEFGPGRSSMIWRAFWKPAEVYPFIPKSSGGNATRALRGSVD